MLRPYPFAAATRHYRCSGIARLGAHAEPRLEPRTRGAMNRRKFIGTLGAGLGSVFVPRLPCWRADDVFVERWSWAMGQAVHVMVFAGSEQEGLDACAAALAELRWVERPLTLFDTASDLCELNRRAGRKRMRVDRELRAVLAQAAAFKHATGGAFNVAVEPLMRVWGFHRQRASAPTAAELAEAREAVLAAVVELDGDVAALGAPPGEAGWPIEIADPGQAREGRTVATTRLRDAALATAANTESIVRYGSLVAGHVMDPATGWPACALTQASVVTRTAGAADALSTAMLVSGREPAGVIRSYVVREPVLSPP